jgi:predicted RNase H-like HicB family nuclease
MSTARYIHWQNKGMWLGYLEEFPDYLTQRESIEQLQENLRDLYKDLVSGEISVVQRVAELTLG